MKYLTVLRHAKSAWDQPNIKDHDRPLNERGLIAAPAIARFLHRTYFGGHDQAPLIPPPQGIIASTAQRAFQTAQFALTEFHLDTQRFALDSRLYLAEPKTVLEVLRGADESLQHLLIVGHNPGLHDFCNQILARASVPRMPTCTAVVMALPKAYWGMADWAEAQLIANVTPKTLERKFPIEYAGISTLGGGDD